jgi:hypothetical protein
MNTRIRRHFDEIEVRLIESSAISSYEIIREEISLDDGKLRLRAKLVDGGLLECFVYCKDQDRFLKTEKYSYHWQDARGKVVRRLDNAPHHPELPHSPHHLHIGENHVEGFDGSSDLCAFVLELERHLDSK